MLKQKEKKKNQLHMSASPKRGDTDVWLALQARLERAEHQLSRLSAGRTGCHSQLLPTLAIQQ